MSILSVKDYQIAYKVQEGYVYAADGIDLEVEVGEIVGIAGESGCGKSSFCNSLLVIKPPMEKLAGEVNFMNKSLPVDSYKQMQKYRLKEISIIPQYAMSALNPILKISRIMSDILKIHNIEYKAFLPEIRKRLQLVDLSDSILDKYPLELSGGMKQRVVMVVSTLLNPKLLICDEVTSALDVSTQKNVINMIKKFRHERLVESILFVTHDISILYQLADTIVIMYAGKIVEKASAEIILSTPLHPYTQLLISSLPEVGVNYEQKRLKGIQGNPPHLLNPPPGCRFRERCPEAGDKCMINPELSEIDAKHYVACWKRVENND